MAVAIPITDPPPSVLIVEDDPLVAAYQAALMEEAGYRVLCTVQDAETAFVASDRAAPDVAIIDVTLMGGIDGITVGRELKRKHGTAIVFVTGHLERAVRQIYDIDAAFIGKPFADREVLRAIEDALRQRAAGGSDPSQILGEPVDSPGKLEI